jgi:hypothetical protein
VVVGAGPAPAWRRDRGHVRSGDEPGGASVGHGTGISYDSWGHATTTVTDQVYTVLFGQAKILAQTTTTDAISADHIRSHQVVALEYIYDASGQLLGARGTGFSTTEDLVFHNTSWGSIEQIMMVIRGQLCVVESTSVTNTRNADGSTGRQSVTTITRYDANGRYLDMSASGTFTNDDGNGNITTGTLTQTYDTRLLQELGLQKVLTSVSEATTVNRENQKTTTLKRLKPPFTNPKTKSLITFHFSTRKEQTN